MSLAPALQYPAWTGWRDSLRAEWTKLVTVRGPAWLLSATVGLTVGVGAAADAATRCPANMTCPVDTVKLSLTGIQLSQAVVAILAVLPIVNEYSTGMIRVTLAAMPRRPVLLAAKAATVTCLVLVAGAFAVFGSLVAGALMLPGHGFTTARGFTELSLAYGPTFRAAAGSVL
jgi:ABC-2 type transport system permease protein